MKPQVKVPPPPSLPQGLIALAMPQARPAARSPAAEPRTVAEPIEATRAWKPNRDLLQNDAQPEPPSDFANTADEPTMVGAINLNNPSLFRSAPPPGPAEDADLEGREDEGATVEFVGALAALDRDDAESAAASRGGEEQTKLYRPERTRLEPEETTDEFEAVGGAEDAPSLGPAPPKVIIAPAILTETGPDPSRSEATKKKKRQRRALPHNESKLGMGMCLLGGLALALSVAWRHPKTAPATHEALARAATVATQLLGR
jgi:hypothetical protein